MPNILDPTPPVRFCISRVRQAVASDERFTDDELLAMINSAYGSACEQSHCLQTTTTITFDPGITEMALPDDHIHTIAVYQAGRKLTPVAYTQSLEAKPWTYYQYQDRIGLSVYGPSVLLFYARRPAPLGFDSIPEWGPEWNYLLRHYVAWQCVLASGGAQTIRKAVGEMSMFEKGVFALRQQANQSWSYGLGRVKHVSERIAR